jgi:hypothetical protein
LIDLFYRELQAPFLEQDDPNIMSLLFY